MTLSASNIAFKGVFWVYVHIFAEQMCEGRLSNLSQDATTKIFQNTAKEEAAYILQHIHLRGSNQVSVLRTHSNVQVHWLINLTPFSMGQCQFSRFVIAHRHS